MKYVRCDNAGENEKYVKQLCNKHGITPEFTAPHTPQLNGVVERSFATVRAKALAMLEAANLTEPMRNKLWVEAINTATYLSNVTPHSSNKNLMCGDEMFYGNPPTSFEHLVPFGQIGYVADCQVTAKFQQRSVKCFMVGYKEHAHRDTYCMYNPKTNRIIETRDITWTKWHGPAPHAPSHDLKAFKPSTSPDI